MDRLLRGVPRCPGKADRPRRAGPGRADQPGGKPLREEIARGDDGPAAADLRRLVWEPLEQRLPAATQTVYLCPDDKLTSVPWAALPGRKAGTVLLDEYALATVPYGQLLLEQLRGGRAPADDRGLLMAVGGVAYSNKPVAASQETDLVASRDPAVQGKALSWRPLPGTDRELESVTALAGERTVARLDGAAASTAAVLAGLPQARWCIWPPTDSSPTRGSVRPSRSTNRPSSNVNRCLANGARWPAATPWCSPGSCWPGPTWPARKTPGAFPAATAES